jgi:hypothetical protein
MISSYVLEWDLKNYFEKNETLEDDRREAFKLLIPRLSETLKFEVKGIHRHDKLTSFFRFKKETDWIFEPAETTFHCFHSYDVKDLALVVIYKEKSKGIKIKDNYLYCFPYWMTYKFLSQDEEKEQHLIKMKFFSESRPWNKIDNVWW